MPNDSPPPPPSGPFAFPPPPDDPGQPAGARAFYPLDFDGIVKTAGSLFRFSWRTLLGAALIPYAVAYLILVPVSAAVSPQFNDWIALYQLAIENNLTPPALPSGQAPGILLLVAAAIGTLLAGLIATGAVIHIGDAVFRGRPTTVRGALGVALRRAPALIGQQLLLLLAAFGITLLGIAFGGALIAGGGVATFFGLIIIVAAFAAMIFIAVRWTLAPQAIVLEEQGAVEGLSRSWRLVAGSGWRVLGYLIVIGLIGLGANLLLTGIPQALFNLDPTRALDVAAGTVLDGLVAVLFAPVAPLLTLLLYYDLRFKANELVPQPGEAREQA